MKKILNIFVILATLVSLASCAKWLDVNTDPDNPNNESWVPGYSQVLDEMEFAMASIISGLYDTPEQVAEDLNDEVQDILDEYWASR